MTHFNFVISQNAKWGHAGFYIDCHRMTVPENILLQKSTDYNTQISTGIKLRSGSMKRYGVRLSVRAAGLLLRTRLAGDMDRSLQQRRVNAGRAPVPRCWRT